MMIAKCFLLICLQAVYSKISIDITAGESLAEIIVNYSGIETNVVTEKDIELFKIDQRHLKTAIQKHYGRKPTNCYVKSPTPWGDLYKEHHWEQVTKVMTVKSSRIIRNRYQRIILNTHNLENTSNKTIKANAGMSQTVEKSLTTSWFKSNELTISEEFEYDVNVIFEKATAKYGLSYTVSWGKGEEKSETETIGTTTAVEVELGPKQAARAELSANRRFFEVEIVYSSFLRGNVAVNFKRAYKGHHFWAPSVQDVMKSGNLTNELTTVENIKIEFYSDTRLNVYDIESGKPL